MALEERVTRLEVEFARRNDQDDRVLEVLENLTVGVRSLRQGQNRMGARLDSIEFRLTSLETDVALIKGWLTPPSADGSGA